MNKQRIIAATLAAALLWGLAGCGRAGKTQTPTSAETAQTLPEYASQPDEALSPLTEAMPAETPTTPAQQSAAGNPVPAQRVGTGYNPLTGMPGYDEAFYAGKKLIGVVVENHPGARPQWGMSTPDVTFEYEVEGGISRMLWLYANADELPAMAGPVRSARHDVVELARGFDLFFIHCGGSSFAYNKINAYGAAFSSMDGGDAWNCFERDNTRNTASEHRLVLRGDALRGILAEGAVNLATDEAHQKILRFADVNAPFRPGAATCSSLHFEFSGSYTYTFSFNAATGLYEANINGSPRVDDQNIRCAYKNLLVLYVDMEDMHTDAGHQDLLLENGGSGLYAANGGYMPITWQKGTDTDMLRLFDANGSELTLNAGKTYIALVRSTQSGKTAIE